MKYAIILICMGVLMNACNSSKSQKNDEEWIALFNGKDLDDWFVKINGHDFGVNYGQTFRADSGILKVSYDQYGDFNDQFGHLYYKVPFSHYHLIAEYRFVGELHQGAPSYTLRNSGIMFHSQDPRKMLKNQDWPISIEMQFLGGLGDGKERPTGNMCSPGTHVVYNGKLSEEHCINSTSKTYHGDQWVTAELIVHGDSVIQHVINGDTVLQYSKPQIGGSVVNGHDPAEKIDGKLLNNGFIALQSEGQPVQFRTVKLLDLSQKTRSGDRSIN